MFASLVVVACAAADPVHSPAPAPAAEAPTPATDPEPHVPSPTVVDLVLHEPVPIPGHDATVTLVELQEGVYFDEAHNRRIHGPRGRLRFKAGDEVIDVRFGRGIEPAWHGHDLVVRRSRQGVLQLVVVPPKPTKNTPRNGPAPRP